MSRADTEHQPFDRAARDAWRHAAVDFAEGLFGHPLPAGAVAEQTKLEQGPLEVDGIVSDAKGVRVHVEFQTRANPAIGLRMTRYWTALTTSPAGPPPEQHLVLLHEGADRPGLGTYMLGTLSLRYSVTRLWQIDPERLLSRLGLARFAPLGAAPSLEARAALLARTAHVIRDGLPADQAAAALAWTAQLATLYMQPDVVENVFKGSDMSIDLSHTSLAIEAREEGLREGRRDMVRRVLNSRFGDPDLTERVAAIPDAMLPGAIDRAATASAGDFSAWLDELQN